MKTYLVSYRYVGYTWGVELKAESFADATARVKALRHGTVDGELKAKIPVPNWFTRLLGYFDD